VPLLLQGERWIRPGRYADYVETIDVAPTLAHLLNIRPPSASEGRVLKAALAQP
jgi:arylsulfatase A-like enzyme